MLSKPNQEILKQVSKKKRWHLGYSYQRFDPSRVWMQHVLHVTPLNKKIGEFRLSKLANLHPYQAGVTTGINSIVQDIMLPIKLG